MMQHTRLHKSNYCSRCNWHFPYKKLTSPNCVALVHSSRVRKSCVLCSETFPSLLSLRKHVHPHRRKTPHLQFLWKRFHRERQSELSSSCSYWRETILVCYVRKYLQTNLKPGSTDCEAMHVAAL